MTSSQTPVAHEKAHGKDLAIVHPGISRLHARFRKELVADRCRVPDAGSSFGTTVNGVPVSKDEGRELESGDRIQFAMAVTAQFYSSDHFHDYLRIVSRLEGSPPT